MRRVRGAAGLLEICGRTRRRRRAASATCTMRRDAGDARPTTTRAVVRDRLKVYWRDTQPMIDYYQRAADVSGDRRRAVAGSVRGAGRGDRRRWRRPPLVKPKWPGTEEKRVIVCRSAARSNGWRGSTSWWRACWPSCGRGGAGVTTAELDALAERRLREAAPSRRSRAITAIRRRSARRSTSRWCTASRRRGAGRRRHRVDRHGREARRVLRRLGGDGAGRRDRRRGGTAARRSPKTRSTRAIDARSGRRARLGYRRRGAGLRGGARVLGRARVRRPRDRHASCTRSRRFRTTAAGRGPRLAEGMVLAIEPMVNAGKPGVKVLSRRLDGGDADGSLSAHFEHTVAVTGRGVPDLTGDGSRLRRPR